MQELLSALANKPDNLVERERYLLEELDGSLETMQTSTELMDLTISYLLDFGKIKGGKFQKNNDQIDIIETVQRVMNIQRAKAEE